MLLAPNSTPDCMLTNPGNASGRDIYATSCRIVDDVRQKFGVELEREVNVLP